MFRNEINVTMRPSDKEVKSFIVFHNHVNVMIYSALSSAAWSTDDTSIDDRARKIHWWAGAEDPLLERAQKIH